MRCEHTPKRIMKHSKEIWDAHENAWCVDWRNHELKEHIKKRILELPSIQDNRISSVEERVFSYKHRLTADQSPEPTHLMDIQFVCYEHDGTLIAGMIPVINVCFSHIFGDFNEDYFGCETELRHGKSFFRARAVDRYELSRHVIGESENWGVRANGRLIWCEDSINSIDQAGWCFSLPMAAVETLTDVDEQIIDPIKVLMQGINPDEIEIPFSSNTLKYMVNDGVWGLAG